MQKKTHLSADTFINRVTSCEIAPALS